MGDQAPLLRLSGVRLPAAGLDGIDLTMARGEVLALLAPPGAGKTALLRVIAGETRAAAGTVQATRPVAWMAPPARSRTVYEQLAEPLAASRLPALGHAARIARMLTLLGLDGLEGRRPPQLTPPQLVRVALARALVAEPPLVLLDDPLAALDPPARLRLRLDMRAILRGLSASAVLATRDAGEAMTLAHRIAVLEAGEVAQCDTPQVVYDTPATAFVAAFTGECNRLPGTVLALEEDMARIRLDCGPEVEARLADAGGPGSRCVVGVRPERVAVAALSAAEMGEGALPAALRDAVFLGDHVRLLLELGEGGSLAAKRPPGTRLPRPGGPAAVAWDPYAAFAFRALR